MKVKKLITLVTLLVFVFGVLPFHVSPKAFAESSHRTFTLTAPGVALEQPDTLLVAARLNNASHKNAFEVKIDSIRLDSAPLLTPTPVPVGEIDADQSAIVQANFTSSQLTQGKQYRLIMHGSYRAARQGEEEHEDDKDDKFRGKRHKFTVKTVIVLPPTAPGSASVNTAIVPAQTVTGAPFPHQPRKPRSLDVVNGPRWTVPTAPFVPGTPTPNGTQAQLPPSLAPAIAIEAAGPIVFLKNNGMGLTSGSSNGTASSVAEPSGGSNSSNGESVVFATANWVAAYSTDGGNTFTQLDPTTIFPNDAVGFCCDQVVQYVPSIDRFVWFIQGNGYRLATASPADIINSGGTAWTYWNLTPQLFGQPNGTGLDYPDLSVGNNSLYMSWDAGFGCPSGCRQGFQVARTSLAGIQAGGTITIEFTDPPDAPMAWGSHIMQNTLDEIFWAGHNSNSQMRVFSLQEGSNTYFWRDVQISSWANNALSSTTPDGQNWLAGSGGFPGNAVIGSTRVSNQLWFAWSAGTDSNFQQPHVQMVTLDRNNGFNKIQQVQIWNNSYAFAYPALATNTCTGEVGLSFEYGGNGNYENHVVGFWGDFVAYITTGSNVGTTRFGDYVTIRQTPPTDSNPGNLFDAFGYGLTSVPPPGTGTQTDVHYVLFGRPASSCQIIR